MKTLYFLAAGAVLAFAAYFTIGRTMLYRYDFDNLCKAARALNGTQGDAATKATELTRSMQTFHTNEARNVFNAAFTVEPNQRYDLIVRGARDLGLSTWNCEELKTYFSEPAKH